MPESHWDPEKRTEKDTFGPFVKDLIAGNAAEISRKASLPQNPAEYKIALPKTWKAPQGVEFALDDKDPVYERARDWAHKNGLSQEAFEEGISMLAEREVGNEVKLSAARAEELKKLGSNAVPRVNALFTWMDARGLGSLKSTLWTAEIVEAWEKHVQTIEGGGFSQQHRVPDAADNGKIPGYENMNYAQRRAAQDARNQRVN